MKRWMSSSLPWFLSVGLHAGVLFAVAHARSAPPDQERAAVWAGNTFEVETLSERVVEPEVVAPAPALPAADVSPVETVPEAVEPHSQPEPEPVVDDTERDDEAAMDPPPAETRVDPAPSEPVEPAAPKPPAPSVPTPAPPPGASVSAPSEKPALPGSEPGASAQVEPAYGESEKKPVAVSLAKALTRACPPAAFPDRTWHTLALGPAGEIEFAVELDEQGRVVRATRKKNPSVAPPKHMLGLVQRTTRMLKTGVFAMTAGRVEAGVQRFELSARIEQGAKSDSVLAEPEDLRQIGRFVEPTPTRPGKADFTYNSGRHVILTIRMLSD